MAGTPSQGGPKSARDADVARDDAIRADPSLFKYWKQQAQDFHENGNKDPAAGPTDPFAYADKELDAEIARRKSKKQSRSARRYPVPAPSNDNGEAE